jgi:hypothetical protein
MKNYYTLAMAVANDIPRAFGIPEPGGSGNKNPDFLSVPPRAYGCRNERI